MLLPERLAGAVYGHLVGDALGVPYEFQPAERIGEVEWRGHGTYDQPPGTWSDDGALMLALLDSLLTVGFDTADQARRALDWQETGAYAAGGEVFDIGNATSAALARLREGTAPEQAGAVDALGNGSLMRILPVSLVFRDIDDAGLVALATRASRVTHGSAEAQVACALYALIARRLLDGEGTGSRSWTARSEPCVPCWQRSDCLAPASASRPRQPSPRSTPSWVGASVGEGAASWTASGRPGRHSWRLRLPSRRDRGRALRQRHGHDRRHRRRAGRHLLGHRRHPILVAPWLARPTPGAGACRSSRGDGRQPVGRHAMADIAVRPAASGLHRSGRHRPGLVGGCRGHDLPARQTLRGLLQGTPVARISRRMPRACTSRASTCCSCSSRTGSCGAAG